MSPILESIGSVKGFGWGKILSSNSYESIATVTVSTATPTISFTSIPATYTHLQIRAMTRDARAVSINTLNFRVGTGSVDTGSNYSNHHLDGNGTPPYTTGVTSAAAISATGIALMLEPGSTATANIFSSQVIDILDYKNSNKYKTVRAIGGTDLNGSGNVYLVSGVWRNTGVIDIITFFNNASTDFVTGSTFALYGIKGA